MSQNVKLKILNFTFFNIISTILLVTGQNFSISCIFMSKLCQNGFGVIQDEIFQKLQIQRFLTFYILELVLFSIFMETCCLYIGFSKISSRSNSGWKIPSQQAFKVKFQILSKISKQFLIRRERYTHTHTHTYIYIYTHTIIPR